MICPPVFPLSFSASAADPCLGRGGGSARLRIAALALLVLLSAAGSVGQDATVDAETINVKTLRRAAAMGNPEAQYQLGLLRLDGFGVPPNPAETVRLHRLAAARGQVNAHFSLRDRYLYGQGVAHDAAESAR